MSEIQTLFKFNDEEHSDSLVEEGTIKISTLHEFRESLDYDGEILDPEEGILHLSNCYHHYDGLAKNADGLIPIKFSPYERITLRDARITHTLELENCNIYSTSEFLFTDSLWQAKKDRDRKGKTSGCVLITDARSFFQTISNHLPLLKPIGMSRCQYLGRTIDEINPDRDSSTNRFLSYPEEMLFVKPEHHKQYMEVRAAWANEESDTKSIITTIPELINFTMKIDVSAVDFDELSRLRDGGQQTMLQTDVVLKDRDRLARFGFGFGFPNEVFSPRIYAEEDTGRKMLGFRSQSTGLYAGGIISGCEIAMDAGRQLVCINELDRIESIKISS